MHYGVVIVSNTPRVDEIGRELVEIVSEIARDIVQMNFNKLVSVE